MRHLKAGRKLGRPTAHRWLLLRNMVTSLLKFEKIETTQEKAKELRKLAEKMISLAKRGDLHARRQALAVIKDKEVVKKLFTTLAPRYNDRIGGYTRIFKTERRLGDSASMAIIELIPEGWQKNKK